MVSALAYVIDVNRIKLIVNHDIRLSIVMIY